MPVMENTSAQTENIKIPIKIKNKSTKPKWMLKDKKRSHKDWFWRKVHLKNKVVIYNKSSYEVVVQIKPRNFLNAVGVRGVAGEFNSEYEEEEYIIYPDKKLKVRNFPTHRYYLKVLTKDTIISKKLCSCADDIIIGDYNRSHSEE